MSTFSYDAERAQTAAPARSVSGLKIWLIALLTGLAVAWPLLYASLAFGPQSMIPTLTGDSYHYLAIARKAHLFHIYTYDGVHVTNGFHPLWQYSLRGLFALLHLGTHESQAIADIFLALAATTLGVVLTSAAIMRMTGRYFLGLLAVPGLYYLVIGVHVKNLWIWTGLDGMESAFSILFGGLFFFVLSRYIGESAAKPFDLVSVSRGLGLVLPFVILSRLDDVFLLPAFLIALLFFDVTLRRRVVAALWIAGPSTVVILAYMVYNRITAGSAMPLSGATKSGFVAFLNAYFIAAVHFPPLMELKAHLAKSSANGVVVFSNSFRFVELFYPALAAVFGIVALWKSRKKSPEAAIFVAICLYILFKAGYNFVNVHPWNQADWYYVFATLCLSVMGAVALKKPWSALGSVPVAKYGIITFYVLIVLFSGSQYFASIVYQPADPSIPMLWQRYPEIEKQLRADGVTGVINVDDGISAFLLDFPDMHGFAFATDKEAQKAHRSGRMLSLAYARGINTLEGFGYMMTDNPPRTDAEIRQYLRNNLAWETMSEEMDQFNFSLVYYDPVLKWPFFGFRPKAQATLLKPALDAQQLH